VLRKRSSPNARCHSSLSAASCRKKRSKGPIPSSLVRAAQARTLRDVERLEWKDVGERLGCSAATAIYLYRATPDAVLEDDLARVDRALYLTAAITGLRQGSCWACAGATWTGPRRRSGSCGHM